MGVSTPLGAKELVDEYFIENRTRLLEIAAFLDRLNRIDPGYLERDFRMNSFHAALSALTARGIDHVQEIQTVFSDPTDEPIVALDRKSAMGAYDRGSYEVKL